MAEIAIVGIGAVFPGAGDAPTFWRNIRSGVDAITEVPPERWSPEVYYRPGEVGDDRFYCRRGGFVDDLADFDPARFGIMPAAVSGTDPDQLLMLRAAAEAMAACASAPSPERTGVIIGRGGYLTPGLAALDQRVYMAHQLTTVLRDLLPGIGEDRLDAVRTAFRERLAPGQPEYIGLVPNFTASRIANRFDLHGPAYTVDAACASSLLAVDHAVRELTSGRCDAVLAGGVHICHHPVLWSVFTQLKALSPSEQIRPFDVGADGTLLSEGAGAVLLKRLPDAAAAGDHVYAVIRGVGVASDGRATSMMNPRAEGQELAIRRAWDAAGLDPAAPDALGLLEAHGTATAVGDQVELESLARVFGPRAGVPAGIGTVKSMIGHTMPASGIAGLIKAALAVDDGVLPPTLNITRPNPLLAATRFEPILQERLWDDSLPRRAAVNAFGFGGINAHVIIESPAAWAGQPRSARPVVRTAAGEAILRLAAGSPDEMAELLDRPHADLMRRADRDPGAGSSRLAIVAPDERKLAVAKKVVARGTPWRGRSDIWFTPSPLLSQPGQVAFLFPGFEPEFAPRIEGIAAHFGLPAPRLQGGQAGEDPREGVVEHALDVIAVGRFIAAALGELGITPGVLAGHSLGEWTAMIVGGVYPEIDSFMTSMYPGMVDVPDVVYAAVGLGASRVDELTGGLGDVVVTHDNCPHQSVVCGPASQIAGVVERAKAMGVLTQTLPFRTGFHSPMYAPYLDAVRANLNNLHVRPASTTLWSATTLQPFPPDPDQVRELVLRHLIEPVRFRQLTQLLHESGVRAFVQVGPGSLTGFVEDTLAGQDYLTVVTSGSVRDGLAQLRRAAAALWAEGLSPRFDRLAGSSSGSSSAGPSLAGSSSAGTMRLRLGGPLVRLPDMALATAGLPVVPGAGNAASGSILSSAATGALAEFGALLAEASAAASAVAAGLTSPPDAVSHAQGNGASGIGTHGNAAAGQDGPEKITFTREFSLRTMPDLIDHSIIPQPPGWPEDSDRFPVVPLTVMLEVMADAATQLVPGRVVTGFEQVTATRWLVVEPATTTRVHASRQGGDRVKVRIEGYASGSVLLGHGYPAPPAPEPPPARNVRPSPVPARDLYARRYMFHGPAFAGITDITSLADDGMTGTIVSLPARGALLDNAGQFIGHWMHVSRDTDQFVLPTNIAAIRLYGPQPPVGERLDCTAWVREVTGTQMRSDAELRTGDGRVWGRIEGWTTRRFATDDLIWRVWLDPESNTLSRQCPGGWTVLWERWPDSGSRELMMRWYLGVSERARYEQLDPLRRRQWLVDVMAAKDAVRRWLWDRGAGPIFPAEVTISGDHDDLRAHGPFHAPRVSLAHCQLDRPGPSCAVAIAAPDPLQFTVSSAGDGKLLVTQPGRAPRVIDAAIPVAAGTAKDIHE